MNILREITSAKQLNDNSKFPALPCNPTNVLTNLDCGKNFSKNIFYACLICDGSLIPETHCAVCKRTFMRKCVKCGHVCETLNHESCQLLMSFGKEIVRKHKSVNK